MRIPTILIDQWGVPHVEHEPLGFPCEECDHEAIFHQCNAHGFPFSVHPHGGVHVLDGSTMPRFLCREHGREAHRYNDTTIRASKYLAKRGFL